MIMSIVLCYNQNIVAGSSVYITFQKWPRQITTYNGEMKYSVCWWTAAACALSQQSTDSMYKQYYSTYTIGGLFSLQNCWMYKSPEESPT